MRRDDHLEERIVPSSAGQRQHVVDVVAGCCHLLELSCISRQRDPWTL